jgi:hypothetical protein
MPAGGSTMPFPQHLHWCSPHLECSMPAPAFASQNTVLELPLHRRCSKRTAGCNELGGLGTALPRRQAKRIAVIVSRKPASLTPAGGRTWRPQRAAPGRRVPGLTAGCSRAGPTAENNNLNRMSLPILKRMSLRGGRQHAGQAMHNRECVRTCPHGQHAGGRTLTACEERTPQQVTAGTREQPEATLAGRAPPRTFSSCVQRSATAARRGQVPRDRRRMPRSLSEARDRCAHSSRDSCSTATALLVG